MPERSRCGAEAGREGRQLPWGNLEYSVQEREAECVAQVGETQAREGGGNAASPRLRERLGFWLGWNVSLAPVR